MLTYCRGGESRTPQQSSGKNFKRKKNCYEKLLKNKSFRVDFTLKVPPLMYKINAHNLSGVRS